MSLKFRLRGLAETFVNDLTCPTCGHEGSEDNNSFKTDHTKVTLSGIVVVMQCSCCNTVFIPSDQKLGIINLNRLQDAVERDSENTGQPVYKDLSCVSIEVERLNAQNTSKVH